MLLYPCIYVLSVVFTTKGEKMKNIDIETIRQSPVFAGLTTEETQTLLHEIASQPEEFLKGSVILSQGETTDRAYLITDGNIIIGRNDYWGNQSIIAHLTSNDIFAETFAFLDDVPITVNVYAASRCTVIPLERKKLMSPDITNSTVREKLLRNLIHLFAYKNHYLSGKIAVLSQRGIRKKLLEYLSQKAGENGSDYFSIDFNRQQLADYLSVDRSALSSEISKLKEEGLIDTYKNHFRLLQP